MRARTALLALLAGLAAFVAVGVLVTEAVAPQIEFSLFVGIPVGVVAGVAAAAVVFAWLEDSRPARRRPAVAVAGFGVAFVVVAVVAVGAFGLRNSVALPVAAVGGVVVAAAAYVWSASASVA